MSEAVPGLLPTESRAAMAIVPAALEGWSGPGSVLMCDDRLSAHSCILQLVGMRGFVLILY